MEDFLGRLKKEGFASNILEQTTENFPKAMSIGRGGGERGRSLSQPGFPLPSANLITSWASIRKTHQL